MQDLISMTADLVDKLFKKEDEIKQPLTLVMETLVAGAAGYAAAKIVGADNKQARTVAGMTMLTYGANKLAEHLGNHTQGDEAGQEEAGEK